MFSGRDNGEMFYWRLIMKARLRSVLWPEIVSEFSTNEMVDFEY